MIIITGISGGVGQKLAQELIDYDDVHGVYKNNKIDFDNKKIIIEQLDICDEESVIKYTEGKDLSKVTIIHAATVSIDGLIAGYSKSDWDKTIDINITGDYLITKYLLPAMINEKWGRIIHLSSVVGKAGVKGAVAYGMSKNAISGFSKGLAQEYGRFNITSNVLNLGYMEFGLSETLDEEFKKNIIKRIPVNRLGSIDNVINAIKFLIESDYVNSAEIDIDGGFR
ncbi:MAG: SDR family oxidoreductase [Pseudomonadota bacterium]